MEFENSKEITSEELTLFRDILSDEENENVEVKISAVKQLRSLAKSLGPLRTRDILLDVVTSQLDILDDEVLYELTGELEYFLPLIGGPKFATYLLPILLKISRSVDETIVRNRALATIKKLLTDIDQEMTDKILISNLVNDEEDSWLPEKCSTISLIPACYSRASPENKILLMQKYSQYLEDSSDHVRNLAAAGLPDLIRTLDIEHVLNDVIPMLNKIQEDENKMVKANAVEIAMSVASKSKNQEIRSDMLNIIEKFSKDKSWDLRHRVAMFVDQILEIFSDEQFIPILLEIFENLTNDDLSQVRIYAARNIYAFTRNLYEILIRIQNTGQKFENIFLEKLMPIILSIHDDISDEVQIELSSTILCFSTLISDECFKNTILPLVVDALENPKPMVFKENLFKNLDYLPKGASFTNSLDSIKKIIENILITSKDSWRTRRSILIFLEYLSRFCGVDYFKDLKGYYLILLKDNTFAVRRTASIILPVLVKRFGANWFLIDILPYIHDTIKDETYLLRYNVIFCVQELLFPSIFKGLDCTDKYLGDLQKMIVKDEKYGIILCKLFRLHQKLIKNLQQKPFENIINTYVDYYNICGENVKIYTEDSLESIIKKKFNFYSIEENDNMCYLEGILILLNKEILDALRILIRDPISNVQNRAKFLVSKIKEFSDELNEEMKNSWVIEYTSQIEDGTWEQIDNELEKQMEEVEIHCRENRKKVPRFMANDNMTNKNLDETAKSVEKMEIFPSDQIEPDEIFTDEMESVVEETKELSSISKGDL